LASTISAEAGASLPVQSTLVGLPGQANGEWIVAFNGPAGQTGNWESLVQEGEVIVIGTAGGGGHITTCVSGSGATAMLVDNATFVNGSGQVTNLANDGSADDIIVAAPHLASQEWAGVSATSVVIYELDTPIVSDIVASGSLGFRTSVSLGSLFTAMDPANNTITEWQVYDTASTDSLMLNGVAYGDYSAASALTAASLASISLLAGSTPTTDTLEVRAYNGTYWGDWDSLNMTITAPPLSPPVLHIQTPGQTWTEGSVISLALGASTFVDPQGETLSYSAKLSNGQTLPAWLVFNATTDSFTGTAPTSAQTLSIVVTATDTSGFSATDTFSSVVLGAPVVNVQTPGQAWTEGKAVSLALPANTFSDPQGEPLAYTASLANGQALPSWLTFNATTKTFSGTAPSTAETLGIKVTATDSSGLAASESFNVVVAPPKPAITVIDPTPNQTWTDGKAVTLVLPSNTFTDALGLKMTFAAYEVSGPNVTSWLHFDATSDEFYGSVPSSASGTISLEVIATDAQKVTAQDLFSVTFAAGSAHVAALTVGPGGMLPAPVTPLEQIAFHS